MWLRRFVLPAAVALVVALLASTATAQQRVARADPPGRAMWTWYWQGSDKLAGWAQANRFDRVYLYCEGGFSPKVVRAIKALRSRGIAVEALAGESQWGLDPGGMLDFVRKANAYQRGAAPADRLAGIRLDVESFDLPIFRRDPKLVLSRYLRVVDRAQRVSDLKVGWDIPYWFDGERISGRSYLGSLIAAADRITIMSYRDSASGMLDASRRELRIGKRTGTPITLGAETGDYKPASITFFQEGRAALERALAKVDEELNGNSAFAGVAVHHYGSLLHLAP